MISNIATYCLSKLMKSPSNSQFIRSFSTKSIPFLKNSDWSQRVAQEIKKNCVIEKSLLCFNIPGHYSLPEAVLKSNAGHVMIRGRFKRHKELETKFPGKLSFTISDYFNESAKILKDYNLSEIEKILVIHGHMNFNSAVLHLLYHFNENSDMWKVSPIGSLIFVTKNVYKSLTSGQTNRKNHILGSNLCDMFLDNKLLLEVPADAFTCKLPLKNNEQADSLMLLSLSLRKEFLNYTEEERQHIAIMINVMRTFDKTRSHRAIPLLDKYCEGVGLSLIEEGIGMMDEIKDIPSAKWPKIIQIITSHPNYKYSTVEAILEEKKKAKKL